MRLLVKRLVDTAVLPHYAHPNDAGLDLYASAESVIPPGEAATIATGLAIELPPGTEAQVRPRSGLARKHAVTVLNTPGTIDEGYRGEVGVVLVDAGYRGEVKVILINHGREPFRVDRGMRVAQLVVKQRLPIEVVEVDELTDSARGDGGFGSTGH